MICAVQGDTTAQADRLPTKIPKMRLFKDAAAKMNLSLRDIQRAARIVSQFTLADDLRSNRPGFSPATPPDQGRRLYDHCTAQITAHGILTQTGIFGTNMAFALHSDGPVTIWMDTDTL